ncbi:MAG TPA: wax ester/triacylglycerol synthase family O-acyltransferase [Acidimicrobiales bacterium]|jgi:WS/DGAT/MGAT family acyltransferase|nr:wax ester/triacylglycerol synthase family O-acyltransferase [Acidimicrobiales bacterium]
MPFERLSPLDAGFLHIEDSVTHMHIGSISIMEGPAPRYEDLRDRVAAKLPVVRRYRQVVRTVPFDLGRPVWADDPWFNIEFHIRHTALPAPGNDGQLNNLVGRVMAQQLDRDRPLWEMWMVEGLTEGRWAIISKVHHCMVDGVAGSELLGLILDPEPDPPEVEQLPWVPTLPPARWELAVEAVTDLISSPFELSRLARAQTRIPRRILGQVGDAVAAVRGAASAMRTPSSPSLNGPIGPHRRWVSSSVSVADIKEARARFGGTFNDVVLSIVTSGFRDLLEKRGESTESPIRSLVPVSVRARDDSGRAIGDGTMANRISAMFAELPVHIENPIDRLHAVSEQMVGLKESKQALAGEVLSTISGFAPPMLLSLAGRLGTKAPQSTVNTITTNVPGPQIPLYAAGRRMLNVFPYVPLGLRLRIGVAIFSYDGQVTFGVTGDYDTAEDVHLLAQGIEEGMADLLAVDPKAVIIDLRRNEVPARS